MKCKTCKKSIEKGSAFCPYCGVKCKRHVLRNSLLILLSVLLLIGASGVALWGFGLINYGNINDIIDTNFLCADATAFDLTVLDAESAIEAIEGISDTLGYKNALSDLSEKATTTISGDTYYRLQQNYMGIPVYGNSIVAVTRSNGEVISLTGNVADVDESISLVPSITIEDAERSVLQYASDSFQADEANVEFPTEIDEELVIINNDTVQSRLAYNLTAYINFAPHQFIIDASTAETIYVFPLALNEAVSGTFEIDGEDISIDLWLEDGIYSLYDHGRNIVLYTANGSEISDLVLVGDENGYEWDFGPEIELEESGTLSFDDRAIQVMSYFQITNDFYSDVLQRDGWSDDYSNQLPVIHNCENSSVSRTVRKGIYSIIYINPVDAMNSVTHEFTHSVEQNENGMYNQGESGAIMEAFSDIMAEACEHWSTGECDWLYEDGLRNIISPAESTEGDRPHPSVYKEGDYWISTDDEYDNGGVHINSTVISRVAYLMSEYNDNGLLNMNEIAELWYRSMLIFPVDCSFAQCRKLVEFTSHCMNLTREQQNCISDSFKAVGITSTISEYYGVIGTNSTLSVYDTFDELYDNYTVHVEGYREAVMGSMPDGSGINVKVSETHNVTTKKPLKLGLSKGVYKITIKDNSSMLQPERIYKVKVSSDDSFRNTNLTVYTDFGIPIKSGEEFNAYLKVLKQFEENAAFSLSMTSESIVFLKQGTTTSKTTTNFAMECDVANYGSDDIEMTGWAEITGAGQDIAYNMRYEDGVAYYDYLRPSEHSTSVEMPFDFLKNYESIKANMVETMSCSMGPDENITLFFKMSGEKITEQGVELLNQTLGENYNVRYGDVIMEVVINPQNMQLISITMSFDASMEVQGYDADVSSIVICEFSVN